jgi:hypothetical protein
MIFAPLSHIKHVVWQPFSSALRDCPMWDIAIERDAYVRVVHTRRQVPFLGFAVSSAFDAVYIPVETSEVDDEPPKGP